MAAYKHVYRRSSTATGSKYHHKGIEKKKVAVKVKNARLNKKKTQAMLLAPEEEKRGEADCER